MRYIDAGYVSALSLLVVYGAVIVGRRRRLERAVGPAPSGDRAPGAGPSAP